MTDSYRSDGFSTFSLCAAVAVAADVHKPMPNCEAILIEDEEKINFFPHFELWSLLQIHIFSLFAGWEDER